MNGYMANPLQGAAGISFGMTRASVRKIVGNNWTEFKKSKFSKNTTDDFGDFHVYYDSNDECIAIEFFNGCKVVVDGKTVLPASTKQVEAALPGLVHDEYGYTDVKRSIGVVDADGAVCAILFAQKGYYES